MNDPTPENPSGVMAALDMGTSKVTVAVGNLDDDGMIHVTGLGSAPFVGLRKGVFVSPEERIEAVRTAVTAAEEMSGEKITSVCVGISGGHIRSYFAGAQISIASAPRAILPADVKRVIEAARESIKIPADREVLHMLAPDFTIDDVVRTDDPTRTEGCRLSARLFLVTADVDSSRRIVESVTRAGYGVSDIVLDPLASSFAVLTEEEKDLGVLMIEFGAGTTGIVWYSSGSVVLSSVIPIGSINITKDISVGMRSSLAIAEKHKLSYDHRASGGAENAELRKIIAPRVEEILLNISKELGKSPDQSFFSSVVLTGEGAALSGLAELIAKHFRRQVRLGIPQGFRDSSGKIASAGNSTSAGLLRFACLHDEIWIHSGREYPVMPYPTTADLHKAESSPVFVRLETETFSSPSWRYERQGVSDDLNTPRTFLAVLEPFCALQRHLDRGLVADPIVFCVSAANFLHLCAPWLGMGKDARLDELLTEFARNIRTTVDKFEGKKTVMEASPMVIPPELAEMFFPAGANSDERLITIERENANVVEVLQRAVSTHKSWRKRINRLRRDKLLGILGVRASTSAGIIAAFTMLSGPIACLIAATASYRLAQRRAEMIPEVEAQLVPMRFAFKWKGRRRVPET